MYVFYVPTMLELSKEIGRLVKHLEGLPPNHTIPEEIRKKSKATMELHADNFKQLELRMCEMLARRIADDLNHEILTRNHSAALASLYDRMVDETRLIKFLCLTSKEGDYFSPTGPLFGSEVEAKFPSAAYEIEEASKCLALGRSTAVVFHLMRSLEITINAIANCLAIPAPTKDAERNWGKILEKIRNELARRAKSGWKQADDRELFAELYALLDAVRVAWRNTTMHVAIKYSPEEAEHIFSAVRGFMKKLALRMDQNGNPIA